jgi:hypothetical protein
MLHANVGLSRKITRDYNSAGFSVNIEGELITSPDQPQAILEQIDNLFRLAEQALNQQIARDQGDQATGRRDERRPGQTNGNGDGRNSPPPRDQTASRPPANGNRGSPPQQEPATEKQVRYLETIGKRQKLTRTQLEQKMAGILRENVGLYQLTKREAGTVIDALTKETATNG